MSVPDPLVSADVDLNGYEFMPLFGERLRRSSFNTRATDAEFRAAINLWWSSWWETPAASLPNNERDLCRLAGLKDLRKWRAVREIAMHKWVLCRDDRWYHPVLADIACSTFSTRKSQSAKGRLGAAKRWGNKDTTDARANAPARPAYGSGITAPAPIDGSGNGTGNSKLSEVKLKNPLPPSSTARSKPPSTSSRSFEDTQRQLQDRRATQVTPPPDGLPPSAFLKRFVKPPHDPFEDDTEPHRPEPPAEPERAEGAGT